MSAESHYSLEVKQLKFRLLCQSFISLMLFFSVMYLIVTKSSFDTINVERINVVEPDGQLSIVLANKGKIADPIMDGKVIHDRQNIAGLIFFNGRGDEVGGLIFDSEMKDGVPTSGGHLSFDRYKQDQVVYLHQYQTGEKLQAGIAVLDRTDKVSLPEMIARHDELVAEGMNSRDAHLRVRQEMKKEGIIAQANRVFLGTKQKEALLSLNDKHGNLRVKLFVDEAGVAKLTFFDENGVLISSLPNS